MFLSIQISHQTKKTIPGEWLDFPGQDARKSRFWTTCDAAKQKRCSGYSCILARVTGALGTDATETEKRNCASCLEVKGDKNHQTNK